MKDLTKGKPSRLILAFALPIFLANLLHLCEQCDPDGAGIDGFNALLNMAMMHYEQENGGDSEEPV